MALKPEAFPKGVQDWITHALRTEAGGSARLLALEGKTCRRSHDAGHGLGPWHSVRAWAREEGIALGQVATDQKSNEITAIPQLLEQIELPPTLITSDAMGCQKAIARQIVDGGGDLVIAVQDNQPTLRDTIAAYFVKHPGTGSGRTALSPS